MCGRYASSRSAGDLATEFEVDQVRLVMPLPPSYNVAPTDDVYVVLERGPSEAHPAERQLRSMRWGLVPSWAKDPAMGGRMINARLETLAQKPAFRRAFAARRCLVPADGYFEWYVAENGTKQPFYIHPADGRALAMAGLYEIWRDPTAPEGEGFLWSCTVITTSATDALGRLHDRMPLMVDRDGWGDWLDPSRTVSAELLAPAMPGQPGQQGQLERSGHHDGLVAWPVSAAVGNVRNNGPELVQPLVEPDGPVSGPSSGLSSGLSSGDA